MVLLLAPEQALAPIPEGRGLVQVRVSVTVRLPVPHDLEHEVRVDSANAVHPPCAANQGVVGK